MDQYHLFVTDEDFKEFRSFWRECFGRIAEPFRWSVRDEASDSPEPRSNQTLESPLAREAAARIEALAADDLGRFTLFASLLTLLLFKYTGRNPVIFKTPRLTGGEGASSTESNDDVPFILSIDSHDTARSLIRKTASLIERAYSMQNFPVAAFLEKEQGVSYSELTPLLVFDRMLHEPPVAPARYSIRIEWKQAPVLGLAITWSPAARLPSPTDLAHHLDVLSACFSRLDAPLAAVSLLSAPERRHLLDEIQAGEPRAHQKEETVVRLFEARAAATPRGMAILGEDGPLTYERLNHLANRLAHELLATFQTGPERRFLLMADGTAWGVVGLLGVMKSGAAFLPVAADQPRQRLRLLWRESEASALLIHSNHMLEVGDFPGRVYALDIEIPMLDRPHENPGRAIPPDAPAYMMFTSGSTGTPKGCLIPHRALAFYARWAVARYWDGDADAAFAMFSPLSFDFTLTCVLGALLGGARLHIFELSRDTPALLQRCFDPATGIEVLKLTPAHISLLAQLKIRETGVRRIIAGGEALTRQHIVAIAAIDPDIEVINEYGPTEATVGCITASVTDRELEIPIGTAIPGSHALVVGPDGWPVSAGVSGEICIGGPGLARGYRAQPHLTARAFLPHPLLVGERLYHTGDLGRRLPDGRFFFLGRLDRQVKIRGFRIELKEVELALLGHPAVIEAAVLVRLINSGDPGLAAFVVLESAVEQPDLRQYLRERLPAYMVPAAILCLERLPLMPNGKLDRAALARGELIGGDSRTRVVARASRPPRSEDERRMAAIWTEALGLGTIGVGDDFFDLGGHSLLATRVVSRVWDSFEVEISIADLFENPTIEGLLAHVQTATPRTEPTHAITRVDRDGPLPLSFSQQRLWFLDRLEGPSHAYNLPASLMLQGDLDTLSFERTITALVERHESLRTCFAENHDRPSQIVREPYPFSVHIINLEHLDEPARKTRLADTAGTMARTPFDLGSDLLFRVRLLRLGARHHHFLFTLHHMISDEWSMGVFIREFVTLYSSYSLGRPHALPALAIQYADFAAWQRSTSEQPRITQALAFWRRHLEGAPTLLNLPIDRPRPPLQRPNGRNMRFTVDRDRHQALLELAHANQASLFMLLHAAFALLLSRYSRQWDIVIGTPIANRTRPDIEPLIGFFVNTLALRLNLSGNPGFAQLLGHARAAALEAYANQHLPFERLVQELSPRRDLSHAPLFQVMLTLQNTPHEHFTLPGLTIQTLATDPGGGGFDLSLDLDEDPDLGLEGTVEYHADLFLPETIQALIGHWLQLLREICTHPAQRIADFEILTEAERIRLLCDWNQNRREIPGPACFPRRFAQGATCRPDARAAIAHDGRPRQVTYRFLEEAASCLAARLRALGMGPESLIALLHERGIDFLTAMLGIFKVGAAYLPLDPLQPPARWRYCLEQSHARLLLTSAACERRAAQTVAALGPQNRPRVLTLPAYLQERGMPAQASLRLQPDNLAYVIFTSGSTGLPKGACVTQAGMVNHLFAKILDLGLSEADIVAQNASQITDISVWQFLAAPLVGGCVQLLDNDAAHDPNRLLELLHRDRTTVLEMVPSPLGAMLGSLKKSEFDLSSLRWMISTGEALAPELCRKWFAQYPAIPMLNAYGPTECSDDVTHHPILAEPREDGAAIPIGRPVLNTRIYSLDTWPRPTPRGVAGEIHVGGCAVGRGYLLRPELTAAAFVPDPFGPEPGQRLYRTGDLGRWTTDGFIEFLGRIDHQVKIRGFRIELGEIEAALTRHPHVGEAAVVTFADASEHKRLVAHVVPIPSQTIAAEALKRFLSERLPEHMLPALIYLRNHLPLTPNGKVDRKALPSPNAADLEPATRYTPPRNEVERVLTRIWQQVLGLRRVGTEDNFFALGGDSILSIQIISRAARLGLRITPSQLFRHQTVAALAAVARQMPQNMAEQALVTGPVPLTPIQQWFFDGRPADPSHFNQSVLLEVPAGTRPDLLSGSLGHLLHHHDALRARFKREPGGWRQEIASPGEDPPFHVIGLGPGRDWVWLLEGVTARVQASLRLERGPLLRICFFPMDGERSARLFLAIHHLVIDGISWRILLEDLFYAYRQLRRGKPVSLPPKTTSYKEWSIRLEALAGSGTEAGKPVPPSRLKPAEACGLPLDAGLAGANSRASVEHVLLELDRDQTELLLKTAPLAYRTRIDDLLLTALALALHGWSGSEGTLVDLEGHGRDGLFEDLDVSRTLGWFTALYPAALALVPAAAIGDNIKSIKEQLRAIPRHGMSHELLHRSSSAEEREPRQAKPRAEILFNYFGQTDQVWSGDMEWRPAHETTGPEQSPRAERSHLLEINAIVASGVFQVDVAFSRNRHHRATMEILARGFRDHLLAIIRHCQTARGFTPSDFPLAGLPQADLDRLPARMQAATGTGAQTIADIYRLSPMQHGMLFHALYTPDSLAYFHQMSCRLRGTLELEPFQRAWEEVFRRHSALRTSFHWEDLEHPVQLISTTVDLPWENQDWRGLAANERNNRWTGLLSSDRERGFELERAPLARFHCIRVEDELTLFNWSQHHLIMDGWSSGILLREVFLLYRSFIESAHLNLETPPPFRGYIDWLQQRQPEKAQSIWREELAGLDGPTPLKKEPMLARGDHESGPFLEQNLLLSEDLTRELKQLARSHGLTLFTLVQGAWGLLLGDLSRRDRVVFGVTVSGRPPQLEGIESMVGLFINTLPLALPLDDRLPLLEWLKALQERQAQRESVAYSSLVDIHAWSRWPEGMPLFHAILVFENFPIDETVDQGIPGLTFDDLAVFQHSGYPLTLTVMPEERMSIQAGFDSGQLTAAEIAHILGRLEWLFEALASSATMMLGELRARLAETGRRQAHEQEEKLKASNLGDLRNLKRRRSGLPAKEGSA